METWEGHHVDGQLSEISIQLAREAEAGGDPGHGGRDEMVQVTIGRSGQFQGAEADVVECLIVNTVRLICVLNKLMD